MNIQIHFGLRVKYFREQKNWSQEDLAEESGLHRTYISGIERGRRNPTIQILNRIAVALDIEPSLLLEEAKK
jgi:transcriptional regulator with XRE-family HTH domain